MGTPWCRGMGSDRRTGLKQEAFRTRLQHDYGGGVARTYTSWWDLAPNVYSGIATKDISIKKDEQQDKLPAECPTMVCPPPSAVECEKYIKDSMTELGTVKHSEKLKEDQYNLQVQSLKDKIQEMEIQNKALQEYSKFVVHVSVGGVVVLFVVVGVVMIVLPRGRRSVFTLPSWKSNLHDL
eukprot:TRINITY_DN7423_c0_g1_i1.p1 TRINITY_DN7423_c0_g1~~TRINITY_DN7423_c0_g1_i1.p1  ORF type:complete len:181 (+),score=41.46 TRINITY_DN7423_c0_g1_i1:150-692(+)